MKFISVDLENNQPSGRITQLAAIAFDTTPGSETFEFNMFIDPEEEMNWDYVLNSKGTSLGELMGEVWKSKWENNTRPRKEALREFWKWLDGQQGKRKIIQWGSGDMAAIRRECKEEGIATLHTDDYDIKKSYKLFYQPAMRLLKNSGLQSACTNMGLTFFGRAHDAKVDAYNTGMLAVKMFNILDNYRQIQSVFARGSNAEHCMKDIKL